MRRARSSSSRGQDLDLVVCTGTVRLWRNDGGLAFTDVSAAALPALAGQFRPAAFGDVDGDGDPDLLLGGVGGADVLLRNTGGTFALVAGAVPAGRPTLTLAFADAADDGDLDLFRGTSGSPPAVARNQGNGVFVDSSSHMPLSIANTTNSTG